MGRLPFISACALSVLAAGLAHAVERLSLQIPAEPVSDALIDLAIQVRISLGGQLDLCTGNAPAIAGTLSIGEALTEILASSNCTFAMKDNSTVLITVDNPASAPEPVARSEGEEEIVVTVNRRPEAIGSAPYALTAVSGSMLSRRRLFGMQDLAAQVAGMSVTNLGPGRNKVILRGVSDGSFTGLAQSPVAIYFENSPITFGSPDPDLRLADISRVEVLRGPQGALYGGGSVGGIIRIVPNPPLFDFQGGQVLASISTTRDGGLNHDQEVMVNLPILQGALALRMVAYREAESGYIDDVGRVSRKVNNSIRKGGRASLAAKLSDTWTATVSGAVQTIETADTHYGLRRLPARIRDQVVREPHDNDFRQARLAVEGHESWGSLSASAILLRHNFTSRFDATAALPMFGRTGVGIFDETKRIQLAAFEATVASPEDQKWSWLAGAYVSVGQTLYASSLTRLAPSIVPLYAEDRSDRTTEAAVYGELTLHPSDTVSLSIGARAFQYAFRVRSLVDDNLSQRPFAGSGTETGVSPRAVLAFEPEEGTTLYAQISGGYRGGGFNTSGLIAPSDATGTSVPRRYRPDTIWNYEIGAKLRTADGRLRLRAAAFLDVWRDLQSDQYQHTGLPFTANVGDGEIRGLELEAAWHAADCLDLGLSALIQTSELTATTDSQNLLPRNAGLPGTSDVSATASFDFHENLDFGPLLRVQGTINYIGHSYLTFQPQRVLSEGGYATINLSVGIEFDDYRVSAFVNNLTDNAANTFAFGNPFRMRSDPEVTPLAPRTFGLQLVASF